MIMPRNAPPGAYIDHPADKLDPIDRAETERNEVVALAGALLARVHEWITRGRNRAKDRAFRSDIAILYLSGDRASELFDCKRPSAAWVGRQHGVSRQRASDVGIEFSEEFGDYLQFRGQRFLNLAKRRGRVRRGRRGLKPGPVAGA
jgi:hypothetical protein